MYYLEQTIDKFKNLIEDNKKILTEETINKIGTELTKLIIHIENDYDEKNYKIKIKKYIMKNINFNCDIVFKEDEMHISFRDDITFNMHYIHYKIINDNTFTKIKDTYLDGNLSPNSVKTMTLEELVFELKNFY